MPDFRKSESVGEARDIKKHSVTARINNDLPEHYEARCKVCTSKYRHAIERMIALGTNHSEIERTFAGEVPRRSISNHAREHLSYEQAAIRAIIEHDAKQINANYEEGLNGALRRHAYLSAGLQKAWEDLIEGNVRIDPAVAIQMIQQLDKMEKETSVAATDELYFQFNAFKTAVQRIVPRDMWEAIFEETRRIAARAEDVGSAELEEG
ncbi:hypothetical protein [Candidatus Solirubrobacter pratensis]|uniref:hypothetical protein n=1 Tax=Candidatus Solirubrobacter pratensis TaxID=1298857 RepID=UPI00041C8323|nr:hypothetical protein [Candidatus Solirubrobacter pratensis]